MISNVFATKWPRKARFHLPGRNRRRYDQREMHLRAALLTSCLILLSTISLACGKKKHAASHPGRTPHPSAEVGVASWYGHPYHGRAAANGEIYDMEKPTAAHRTLPFGTWVRVTNLANGKTTEVRITDRGPFIAGRIIDVSHSAAREIGLIGPGIAQVRIDPIAAPVNAIAQAPPPAPVATSSAFAVQVGAFEDRRRAEQMREALVREYGAAQIVLRQGQPVLWRVLVGREDSMEGASQLADRLRSERGPGFVVRLDQLN